MLKILILVTAYLVAVTVGDEADPFCIASHCCSRGCMITKLRKAGYSIARSQNIAMIARTQNRRCSCHPTCHYFGTCCSDADFGNYFSSANMFSYSKCLLTTSGLGARVIDRCPPALPVDDERVMKCHEMDKISENDRGYSLFVNNGTSSYTTSVRTQLTYKNKWCALCNMEKQENIVEWGLKKTEFCRNEAGVLQCVHEQVPPDHTKPYGNKKLRANFYLEDLYLFHDTDTINVCGARDVRYCPDKTEPELDTACLYGPQRVVQDEKTRIIYANEDCARCHGIDTLKSCKDQLADVSEEQLEQAELEVVSTSSTTSESAPAENEIDMESENENNTKTSTTSSTTTEIVPTKSTSYPATWPEVTESTASTASTQGPSSKSTTMAVTDVWFPSSDSTSSSSTSTTTWPSTTTTGSTSGEAKPNELNAPNNNSQEGWFPSGSVLAVGHGSPRGHVHNHTEESQENGVAPEDTASENGLHGETHGDPIPSGTQIRVDNSHPRGAVLSGDRFSLESVRERINQN